MDITETLAPKSDQVNADDLISPVTVTVAGVNRGDADQPVNIELVEFPGRAYRPCKSMRRVLVFAWGADASAYTGRRMTLFNDPAVKWGGAAVGGIRISHLSHIDKPLTISLTETRGKRKPHRIDPLPDEKPAAKPPAITDDAVAEFERDIAAAKTTEQLDAVGADLMAWDLGAHKERLQAAGRDRRAAIEAEVAEPKSQPAEEK